ncbi:transmembrane protein [Arabidopsis thaliana]|uniref:Transmembrane protein n=1 Tax=Arabidopsis thaliana TaxID=3702 RepID=F4KBH3_ARATH|nr:uncharacterized protein AT5G29070 [Arabidopsis thaliana]AED93863.1 transmembrane protein [Arabidopsis thaliana]|eukprot:NP_198259.1 transmembrane protein [Arabidopsis thaliana]
MCYFTCPRLTGDPRILGKRPYLPPRIHWFLLLLGYLAIHNLTLLSTNLRLLKATKVGKLTDFQIGSFRGFSSGLLVAEAKVLGETCYGRHHQATLDRRPTDWTRCGSDTQPRPWATQGATTGPESSPTCRPTGSCSVAAPQPQNFGRSTWSMTWSMVQHTPISAKLRPARVAHTAYCGHTAGVPRAYYGHTAGTLRANWGILGQTAGASRAKSYSSVLKTMVRMGKKEEKMGTMGDEMFKGNEPSDDEGNGRWDPMLLEKELNQKSLMNRLRLDEERSKGKMVDKEGEDERQKGKRAAELEMGSEKA